VTRPDATEVVLAALGRGELIDEMSLADSMRRSANVITLEETNFLLMYCGTFRASVEELPTMALNLANVLSRRLRLANATTYDTTNGIGETPREGKERASK
jgi:CRP/FNR family transcriptional regulator, cyclic AMP receptor protein